MKLRLAALATTALTAAALAQPAIAEEAPPSEAVAAESALANEFFENAFEERILRQPEFLTRLGRREHYGEWDERTDKKAVADMNVVKRQLDELERTIDRALLDNSARLSYDLFVHQAKRDMTGFEYRFHTYPVNQMYGIQATVPAFLINYHRIDTLEDASAYIDRLNNVARLFDQVIDGLKVRADKGIVPPKFVFPYVLGDARNVVSGKPFDKSNEDCTMLADFRTKVDALNAPEAEKKLLMERANKALKKKVKPAYDRLIAYLTELEKSATTDDGAWKFPEGGAYYQYRLEYMTTTKMTADEIHQLGLEEVARIHGEMRDIMDRVEFTGSLQDFFAFMREDKRFYFDDTDTGRQAYLDGAVEVIDGMKGRLDELFLVKPQADIIVKAVEPFREKSAGKAFYERPAPDGSRPGTYYANLYRMEDMPTYQMEALAYHEGIPGHHMQLAIAIELDDIPTFRKYARYTAHTEGWGLYSEYVPKEIGFYRDPYSDFGRLAMELWRACRLVVDTGIHDEKWSREKAIAYLDDNTPNPHNDAVKAIERYIVMPGQATAYKIGMNKLLELRDDAAVRLGDRYDIRGFHDVVLKNGPVPLSVLETLVDEWVEDGLSVQ